MPDSKITVEIVGDKRKLDAVLGRIDGDVGGLGTKMAAVGKAIGAAVAAGFTAVAAGVVYAVSEFAEFDKAMNEVFTLLPGISGKAMREMEDQVLSFSREFNVLPEQVVPALYQSLSAGVPRENVFEFLETATKLSKGGVTDLETAVDGLSSVVNAYGRDIISAEEASDTMFTTVRLGKTTVGELSSELAGVTPIAAKVGVSFGDIGAAIATITSQGTSTSEAVTGLRALLVELSDSGTEVGEEFERIAGKSFPEFIASGGDLGDAMKIIQQISRETGIPVQQLFSSIEAGTVAAQLTGKGLDSLRGNIDEMGNASGATEKAWKQMTGSLTEAFDSLKVDLAVLAIEVGRELAPAIRDLADLVEKHSDEIADAVKGIVGATVSFIEEMVKQIAGFMNALDGNTNTGSKALRDFKNDTAAEVEEMTSDWGRLSEALSTLSFGEVAGLLIRDFANVSKAEREFGNNLAKGIGATVNVVIEGYQLMWNAVSGFIEAMLQGMAGAFGWVPGLGPKLRAAADWFSEFRDDVNANIDGLQDQVDIFFEGHDHASDKINDIRDNIRALQDQIYGEEGPPGILDYESGPRISGPGLTTGGLNPYDEGGVIPGPVGAPVPILAHAGETVLPTHRMSAEAAMRQVGLSRDDIAYGTAAGMQMAGGWGDQMSIGTVNVNAGSTDPTDVVELLHERQRRHALLGSS